MANLILRSTKIALQQGMRNFSHMLKYKLQQISDLKDSTNTYNCLSMLRHKTTRFVSSFYLRQIFCVTANGFNVRKYGTIIIMFATSNMSAAFH